MERTYFIQCKQGSMPMWVSEILLGPLQSNSCSKVVKKFLLISKIKKCLMVQFPLCFGHAILLGKICINLLNS
jgi:hypothetical protein